MFVIFKQLIKTHTVTDVDPLRHLMKRRVTKAFESDSLKALNLNLKKKNSLFSLQTYMRWQWKQRLKGTFSMAFTKFDWSNRIKVSHVAQNFGYMPQHNSVGITVFWNWNDFNAFRNKSSFVQCTQSWSWDQNIQFDRTIPTTQIKRFCTLKNRKTLSRGIPVNWVLQLRIATQSVILLDQYWITHSNFGE